MTHRVTKDTEHAVSELAKRGMKKTYIADFIGITMPTFNKHYADLFTQKRATGYKDALLKFYETQIDVDKPTLPAFKYFLDGFGHTSPDEDVGKKDKRQEAAEKSATVSEFKPRAVK